MKRILIIEDEQPLCEAIELKLKKEGVYAVPAHSAEEGMEILKQNGVDLIWLDLKLPKMSGIEFLEIIKKNPEWKDKNIKVIIVSVSGSDEIKEKAQSLGAIDYIVKSEFKLEDIVRRVALAA